MFGSTLGQKSTVRESPITTSPRPLRQLAECLPQHFSQHYSRRPLRRHLQPLGQLISNEARKSLSNITRHSTFFLTTLHRQHPIYSPRTDIWSASGNPLLQQGCPLWVFLLLKIKRECLEIWCSCCSVNDSLLQLSSTKMSSLLERSCFVFLMTYNGLVRNHMLNMNLK